MPTLVQRPPTEVTTAPLRKRRGTPWWQIFTALFMAVLLLVGLILLLAWALPHWPRRPFKKGATPLTLNILSPESAETPAPAKTEATSPEAPYMRTNDEQHADTPPPDPAFSSSQDTNAASEKAAEDAFKPLPTQDGRDIAAFDFTTRPYIPGKEAHDVDSAGAPALMAAEPVPSPPPATPKPPAKSAPTPRPAAAKPTPKPDDFADLKADASPSNTPPDPSANPKEPAQDPLARQAAKIAREDGRVSSTAPRQPPGYQPQTTQTRMAGSINNHGASSVAAKGTPLGRYQQAIEDAIGARWYFNVEENMSNLVRTGQVKVHFVITRAGKVINTRIEGPNPNTTLADISLEAVVNAEVPPIPSEVAATLPDGQLEGDLTFIMY